MTDIAALITAVCAGVSVFGACLWWVVSTAFSLRAKLVGLEAQMTSVRAEIDGIHGLCHGRELWLKEVNPSPPGHRRTVTRNQISYQ